MITFGEIGCLRNFVFGVTGTLDQSLHFFVNDLPDCFRLIISVLNLVAPMTTHDNFWRWSWEPLNLVQKLSTGSNPEGHLQRSANSDLMFQLLQIQSYVNIQFRQKLSCVVMGATKFSTEIINRKQSGRSFTKKCKLWSNVPVTPNTKLRKHPISPKVIMCGHGSH